MIFKSESQEVATRAESNCCQCAQQTRLTTYTPEETLQRPPHKTMSPYSQEKTHLCKSLRPWSITEICLMILRNEQQQKKLARLVKIHNAAILANLKQN